MKTILNNTIHLYVAEKIKDKFISDTIQIRKLAYHINIFRCIPKDKRFKFLKEMEDNGIIKIVDKQNIKIL